MEVGVAFFFFGQPITWIASKTIFSKIVDKQYVGKNCICPLARLWWMC